MRNDHSETRKSLLILILIFTTYSEQTKAVLYDWKNTKEFGISFIINHQKTERKIASFTLEKDLNDLREIFNPHRPCRSLTISPVKKNDRTPQSENALQLDVTRSELMPQDFSTMQSDLQESTYFGHYLMMIYGYSGKEINRYSSRSFEKEVLFRSGTIFHALDRQEKNIFLGHIWP